MPETLRFLGLLLTFYFFLTVNGSGSSCATKDDFCLTDLSSPVCQNPGTECRVCNFCVKDSQWPGEDLAGECGDSSDLCPCCCYYSDCAEAPPTQDWQCTWSTTPPPPAQSTDPAAWGCTQDKYDNCLAQLTPLCLVNNGDPFNKSIPFESFTIDTSITVFTANLEITDHYPFVWKSKKTPNDDVVFGHLSVVGYFVIEPSATSSLDFSVEVAKAPVDQSCYSLLDVIVLSSVYGTDISQEYTPEYLAEHITLDVVSLDSSANITGELYWDPPLTDTLPAGFYDINQPDIKAECDCLLDTDGVTKLQTKSRHLAIRFTVTPIDNNTVKLIIYILSGIAGAILLTLMIVIICCRPRFKAWLAKRQLDEPEKERRDNPELDFHDMSDASSSASGGGLEM